MKGLERVLLLVDVVRLLRGAKEYDHTVPVLGSLLQILYSHYKVPLIFKWRSSKALPA